MAAERTTDPRRVLIEDTRRNGRHLQATWHPETGQFVVSTWEDGVCLTATRVASGDAARLASLLMSATAEAAGVAGGSLTECSKPA
jgi:hypothetical protein